MRTNLQFTLETSRMKRTDLDEFVSCYQAKKRKPTWSEKHPEGRWRAYDYAEIAGKDGKGGRDSARWTCRGSRTRACSTPTICPTPM